MAARSPTQVHARRPLSGLLVKATLVVAWSGEAVLAQMHCRQQLLDALGSARVALALDNSADWVLWDLALLFRSTIEPPGITDLASFTDWYWTGQMGSAQLLIGSTLGAALLGGLLYLPVAPRVVRKESDPATL